jgi:hypothetical protein
VLHGAARLFLPAISVGHEFGRGQDSESAKYQASQSAAEHAAMMPSRCCQFADMDQQRAERAALLEIGSVRRAYGTAAQPESTMRKFLIANSAALIMFFSGAALAGESRSPSASANMASSVSIRKGLEDMGYQVGRINAEHDWYEVVAMNDSGLPIKVIYDAARGELLQAHLLRTKKVVRDF